MEVVDFASLSLEDHEEILSQAPPCEDCLSCDNLVLGVMTSGEAYGKFLILCTTCHLEDIEKI